MKTVMMHRAALDRTALRIGGTRIIHPATRLKPAANTAAAIERQLDEIQHTFGVGWEW